MIAAVFCLAGCVSTGPKLPVSVQPSLSQMRNLVDSAGKELPVRIALHLVDHEAKPTVIVGHGSAGVTPIERKQAFNLVGWGYNAVVVDHYTARGIKVHTGMRVAGGLPDDRAADMVAVAKWVQQQPWHKGKIAIIGVSQGGAGVWALANEKNMRSHSAIQVTDEDLKLITVGVAMYPACAPDLASPPRDPIFPVQLHIGEADDLALPRWCETFGNPKYEKHIYARATHSFNYAGVIPNNTRFTHRYDREADELSQSRIKSYLDKHLKN
jgi:dienelactone hydrolase